MAKPITIDVLLKAKNETGEGIKEAAKDLRGLEKISKAAAAGMGKMGEAASSASQGIRKAGKSSREAQKEMDGLGKTSKDTSKGLDGVEKNSKKTRRGLDDMEKAAKEARRTLRELAMEKTMILLEAKDRLTPILERVGTGLKGITQKAWQIPVRLLDYATRPIHGLISTMDSFQETLLGISVALGGILGLLDMAGDYEQTEMGFSMIQNSPDQATQAAAGAEQGGISAGALFMDELTKRFEPEQIIKAVFGEIEGEFKKMFSGGVPIQIQAAAAGGLLAAMGLEASFKDLKKAQNADLTWDQDRYTRQGLTKGGLVVGGAAIGSLFPGVGTLVGGLIGAGIGGIAALTSGNSISEMFKSERERAHESLLQMGDDLEQAIAGFDETTSKTDAARGLIDEYQELREYMNSSDFDHTKAEAVQGRMKQLLGDLQLIAPGLISGYEELNGLSDKRIEGLDTELERMDEQAKRRLEQTVTDTKDRIPDMDRDYQEIVNEQEQKQEEWDTAFKLRGKFSEFSEDMHSTDNPEERHDIAMDANALSAEYGLDWNFTNNYSLIDDTWEELKKQTKELDNDLDNITQQKTAIDEQLQVYYDSSVKLIEMNTGIDIEEQSEKLATLQAALDSLNTTGGIPDEIREAVEEILPGFEEAGTAAEKVDALSGGIKSMKDEIQPAIQQISELNKSLENLPDIKRIQVSVTGSVSLPPIVQSHVMKLFGGEYGERATGGFVTGAELSWIGEDGPEAVIPLSGKYRKRGLELFEAAGRYLGVGSHADGAIYTGAPVSGGKTDASGGNGGVFVQVSPAQVNIQIDNGDTTDNIMSKMRQAATSLSDQLFDEMARKVLLVIENMP